MGSPDLIRESSVTTVENPDHIETMKEKPSIETVSAEEIETIDGKEPTDVEARTLRHVAANPPSTVFLIAVAKIAEQVSFFGTLPLLQNFVANPLPPGSTTGAAAQAGANASAGALGLGQSVATSINTAILFWINFVPLGGGYLADAVLGRYKTILVGVCIEVLAHIIVVIAALPTMIVHHKQASLAVLCTGHFMMATGAGILTASMPAFLAEQVDTERKVVKTLRSGERVVVDGALTLQRLMLQFYLIINIGALVGQLSMPFVERSAGYWPAYLIPTCIFILAPLVFASGHAKYKKSPPSGSVIPNAIRVLLYVLKPVWSLNPVTMIRRLRSPTLWSDALPSNNGDQSQVQSRPRWMNEVDDNFVLGVRSVIQATKTFMLFPFYRLTTNNLNTNLVTQGSTMQVNGAPNEVVSNLDPLALIVLIPTFDYFLYPFLRNKTSFDLSPLRRIAIGFLCATFAMIWAAVVQHYIYKRNPCGRFVSSCADAQGNRIVSSLNIWITSGSFIFIALSEIGANITAWERSIAKSPLALQSMVFGVLSFLQALGSVLAEATVPLSKDPYLVIDYTVCGSIAFAAFVLFVVFFSRLDKEERLLGAKLTVEKVEQGGEPGTRDIPKTVPIEL